MAETLQTFGRYSLLKRLARGGMAEIFLAAQPGPGSGGGWWSRDSLAVGVAAVGR